ncbi:MAG: hypothetical protein JWO36_7376 [Myxococcales bacterium]|nr:hypothetical protein [Myxococcales bacterium]
MANTSTQTHAIERSYVETGLSYQSAVDRFEAAVGRIDQKTVGALAARAAPWPEVEGAIATMTGPSGLMIVALADQGAITSLAGVAIRCRLYLVGNPVIAAQIFKIDVRAALYVPFRVAIHEAAGTSGAMISFDRPSSFLGALDRPELQPIGVMLDRKIDAVVQSILRPS